MEIPVVLKHISFWRTPEMTLINCEINLMLNWSANCVTVDSVAGKEQQGQ